MVTQFPIILLKLDNHPFKIILKYDIIDELLLLYKHMNIISEVVDTKYTASVEEYQFIIDTIGGYYITDILVEDIGKILDFYKIKMLKAIKDKLNNHIIATNNNNEEKIYVIYNSQFNKSVVTRHGYKVCQLYTDFYIIDVFSMDCYELLVPFFDNKKWENKQQIYIKNNAFKILFDVIDVM
jgi:hypothetical protein